MFTRKKYIKVALIVILNINKNHLKQIIQRKLIKCIFFDREGPKDTQKQAELEEIKTEMENKYK